MNFGKETEFIEFKLSTSQTPRALESIAAMLNKHDRVRILFGVNDKGDLHNNTNRLQKKRILESDKINFLGKFWGKEMPKIVRIYLMIFDLVSGFKSHPSYAEKHNIG